MTLKSVTPKTTLAVLAALALLAVASGTASAAPLPCGSTIAADTTLDADVSGCTGDALVVTADGVTLDLGGHVVEGTIAVTGHDRVTVRNGSVHEGDVALDGTREASVTGLHVEGGFISCVSSEGCDITWNVVRSGGIAVARSAAGAGSVIRWNLVKRAPGAGISVSQTSGVGVLGNLVRNGQTGIQLNHADELEVAGNVVVDEDGAGIEGSFGAASTFVRNLVARNGGDGLALDTWSGPTKITRNLLAFNGGDGLRAETVAHWTVSRNLATKNAAAGFAIGGAVTDALLAHNSATRNGALGIDAAPAVVDGGGNRAYRNGAAAQCAGVACR
jgi:Right handed beta helix region